MTTRHRRTHKKHNKRSVKKRNVAKGRTQSLREAVAKSRSSSVRRLRSQGFRPTKTYKHSKSSSSPNKFETLGVKEVRINTPENQIYEYYLASSEKDWKLPEKVKGIQKCKKQKMDLVVIRVNKSGNLLESAPCFHCTRELQNSKVVTINKLYFSRWDGTITCIKFSEWLKKSKSRIFCPKIFKDHFWILATRLNKHENFDLHVCCVRHLLLGH